MKKSFESFSNSLENSIDGDFSIINSPFFLENFNNFNFSPINIFTQENIQLYDYDEGNEKGLLNELVNEINISNQIDGNFKNNNIINKKPKMAKFKLLNFDINHSKKFQLFNKGSNNSFVNEVINSISNIKKQPKKFFEINNFDNVDSVKLIGRKRNKKHRNEETDNIRKKLKARFHKIFTKKINENLKSANSIKEFYLMPQIFICNINKKQNKEVMNMKLKDLLRKNFIEEYKQYITKNIEANNDKYSRNLRTLEYLEKNVDVQEKSKFNIIGEMKYFEILEEFFNSEEFEDTVISESKKKPFEYVKDYVKTAKTYVKYFLYD